MDSSIASYASIVISLVAVILGIINHKRIRSSCCGKEASVSLDIEATTPPTQKSEPLVYNGHPTGGEESSSSSQASRPEDSKESTESVAGSR